MLFFLLCLSSLSYAYGGSKCPNRTEIYPCICFDQPIGKSKFDTTVICQGLQTGRSLMSIEPGLSEMEIDTFLLYDSYWPRDRMLLLESSRVPVNILSTFRMKAIQVVDTSMASFACPESDNCRTDYLKRFTAINSSVSESCTNQFSIKSWVTCPESIETIEIINCYSSETTLKPEFFPDPLRSLHTLAMPDNKISKIDKRTFSPERFPVLLKLDLSRNMIRDAKVIFSSTLKLKYLDLSFNAIRTLPDFTYLPHLTYLNLSNNAIVNLIESEWQRIPPNLRNIDLSGNNFRCDCRYKWINSTFHMNANLIGKCTSPHEVEGRTLRRASRLFIERCDDNGNILPSKIKRT